MSDYQKVTYLGDGCYAEFDKLGDKGITFMANHHKTPTDTVHLEPKVMSNFMQWLKTLPYKSL